jgi:WhiB family transcriptional regulator, redox-sensing transcriptional regulator
LSNRGPREYAEGVDCHRAPAAEDVAWQLRGECTHHEPELWYSPLDGHIAEAKRICYECPVLKACRSWALSQHETIGVWGGLSEQDRALIWHERRRRRRVA